MSAHARLRPAASWPQLSKRRRSEQSDLLKRISNARKFLTRVRHEIEPKHGIVNSMMHSNLFPNKHNMHDLLDLCVVLTRRLDYASNVRLLRASRRARVFSRAVCVDSRDAAGVLHHAHFAGSQLKQ